VPQTMADLLLCLGGRGRPAWPERGDSCGGDLGAGCGRGLEPISWGAPSRMDPEAGR
jgi:hypothetical protein